jgi:hypothetical protein
MITREAIVATARAWIGTPYHHQAIKARDARLGLIARPSR